ncbi:MAG: diacylglycerol kinase family lipid kinase [Gemmatimonadota bacterium]|nr:diacylglycerol kinase family lipid kinase [Gemmatimonadota bacterium]MDE2953455.1 diacylglycerol kinase family lipid kinase [Gemmatimonadota bacterium]
MSNHWTIIANPVSGRGRARRTGERVADLLHERGVYVDLMMSGAPGDCERLAREALARGVRQVAACGGDGTVHEVVNGLANSDAVLGIVPCGRGNDLVRALGLSSDVEDVVNTLVHGVDRAIDLGKVGDRFFATVASLGFDTAVAQRMQNQGTGFLTRALGMGGTVSYGLTVLRTLVGYRSSLVRLRGDFGVFEGRILLAATANAPFYGSGVKIAPDAMVDDGVLDVCIVADVSRWTVLRMFLRAYSGAHVGHSAVRVVQTRTLQIESDDPLWIFADGEPMCEIPAKIEVVPGALKVKV